MTWNWRSKPYSNDEVRKQNQSSETQDKGEASLLQGTPVVYGIERGRDTEKGSERFLSLK